MVTPNYPHVAVLGLGPMGAPIARNLLSAGAPVTVWNRTASVARPYRELGAEVAAHVADVAADVVLSVLPDVDQLRQQLTPPTLAAWAQRSPTRLVVMSTTSPDKVQALAADLAPHAVTVADAPMSGGDRGAQEATLSIMVGANDDDWRVVRPVLEVLGRRVVRFGPPGAGSVAKLCNQVVVGATLAALGEALALAEHAGLDLRDLVGVLEGGLAGSAALTLKKEKLLNGDYSLGGSARNQLKDLRYARAAAQRLDASAPLTELLTGLYEQLVDLGHADSDHSAVLEWYRAQRRTPAGG